MTYWSYPGWYIWTSKTCWLFEIFVVFIFLSYVLMIAIPKLLLLRTIVSVLLFWIPALFAPTKVMKFIDNYLKNEELWRLLGVFVLIFAFLFFMVHVSFDGTWYMVFSILWRLSMIKGIRLVWFPTAWVNIAKSLYGKKTATMIMWVVTIVLCIFLLWVAVAKI